MHKQILRSLLGLSLISVGLLAVRLIGNNSYDYWYMVWNLFLAWLPLLFAYYLCQRLNNRKLEIWPVIILGALWLGFLPNSFYLATDFIHLQDTRSTSILLDIVMLMSYTITGLALGYSSVIMIHSQLKKMFKKPTPEIIIAVVFLLCSFAIYLGRFLRWNTWDVVFNPVGIIFDVSERIINPGAYEQTFSTTALFFVFISAFYLAIWDVYKLLPKTRSKK